mgnify:CR=1 FL=1
MQNDETKTELICRLIKEVDAGVEASSAAEALEFRREQYGLSRKDFCYILSIGVGHYSEIINGKRSVPMSLARRANAIGVPLKSLVHGSI